MATFDDYVREAEEWWNALRDKDKLMIHWRETDNKEE